MVIEVLYDLDTVAMSQTYKSYYMHQSASLKWLNLKKC